jgi:predicted dehydrogenase
VELSRRDFVKVAAAGGTALATKGCAPFSRPMGSNNDIRLGIVGFNSHGKSHIRRFQAIPKGVRIVALCDADTDVIDRGVKEFFNGRGQKVDTYTDIRELLDRDDIDAISGAQPNHWHSLAAVWACQAGKDVCVEKPVSHNVWEGRKVVEAARKYNRVVQADLDRRTSEGRALAHKYVQEGKLGKIIRAHSFVYKRRESMGKLAKPVQPPASVDYNLWSGAARVLPVTRERFHYDWHWLWEYGGGETCNNGPHTLDVVRACLGHMDLPKRVMAYGGRYGYDDVGETPNTQVAILDYEPAPIYFEVRGLPRKKGDDMMDANHMKTATGVPIQVGEEHTGTNNGAVIVCEHGYVVGDQAFDNDGKLFKTFEGDGINKGEHFINAMRSRKISDLRVDILEGHLSTTLCHLANIAWKVGKEASTGEVRTALQGDETALERFAAFRTHLTANGVNVRKEKMSVGTWLDVDSKTERFTGGDNFKKANTLLKREYREPFVIRENV